MSTLRVSVEWQNKAVFAGEALECKITFKNTAQVSKPQSTAPHIRNRDFARDRWRDTTAGNEAPAAESSRPHSSSAAFTKGHQYAVSSNHLQSTTSAASESEVKNTIQHEQGTTDGNHRRSISIVSIGSGDLSTESKQFRMSASRRPGQGHNRAASLQILPVGYTASTIGHKPTIQTARTSAFMQKFGHSAGQDRAATVPAMLRTYTSSSLGEKGPAHEQRTVAIDQILTPNLSGSHSRTASAGLPTSSQTLQTSPAPNETPSKARDLLPNNPFDGQTIPQSLEQNEPTQVLEPVNYPTKAFSSTGYEGTPRSSTDAFSISDNSSDTLASEYVNPENNFAVQQIIPPRHHFQRLPHKPRQAPETLMMGYGNIVGVLSLDPSLINLKPFDEVKRKAVIGNQGGGGVVRSESTKRQSGLLGSLGWNALGESLGGLLGGREVSSIKSKATDPKWIPLVSTPQSLLFIDLRLEPGQSQSYWYHHQLPAGLPPSYKGKAMKISYNIVIGVQRATQSAQRHVVRHLEFPFRVLPSVNANGETLGHNLMSPYVLLHSEPLISPADSLSQRIMAAPLVTPQTSNRCSDQDLLSYVGHLLESPSQESSAGLLSPSAAGAKSPASCFEKPATMEGAVTLAIQQSNSPGPSKLSANRFEIGKSGSRVAVIMLARPAYRLGEIIPITIDFHNSDIQCCSLCITLETVEHIDPTIALRSQGSIARITRRVYATKHVSTTSTLRVCLNLAIPSNSTPEFITSGVSLEWILRCEFVTGTQVGHGREHDEGPYSLLEEVTEDDRGSVSAAIQALQCETFEVQLPVKVYGDRRGFDDSFRVLECQV